MRRILLALLILVLPAAVALSIYFLVGPRNVPTSRDAVGQVTTLAGAGSPGYEDGPALSASFSDPFGIAVDDAGRLFVSDGGRSNHIRMITTDGKVETVAGSAEGFADGPASGASFNTPSGIAIDTRGNIIIADTANNCIRKLDARGRVSTVAGTGSAGFKDGAAQEAQFDGPVGVAVDDEGTIFVADSYNDRIRKISVDDRVTTIAGAGSPGLSDGQAEAALFDTPCGVAVDEHGNIFVADTANDRIRKITPQGEVTTIGGDEQRVDVKFDRPIGIAVTHDGFLFVADSGNGRIRRITPEGEVSTIAGLRPGFTNGLGHKARFNGPSGIAVDRKGNLYVADTQNYLIRRISPAAPTMIEDAASEQPETYEQPSAEPIVTESDAIIPDLRATLSAVGERFPWPLNPQNRWREVTGVMGEARGAPGGIALHHLHSGLDIRGSLGEPVLSVLDEKVSSPTPVWDIGGPNEGINVGLMSYIHIHVGRDQKDGIQSLEKFKPTRDENGEVVGVRVRRGTRFKVGDFIGSVNRLYHVHLNLGPWNAQANPMQFRFVDFKDRLPPVIEPDGIEVVNMAGHPFTERRGGRLVISGDVDIVVTAFDKVDGNGKGRKLGLYKLGYQLFKDDGTPVGGFEQPLINVEFNRLPPGDESVFVAYAPGSGVSAYGTPTKFKYFVTNRVRDGEARDGFLRASALTRGDYILKIIAEDFAGNRASGKSTELPLTLE